MRTLRFTLLVFTLLVPAFAADAVTDDHLFDQVRISIANDREAGGGKIDVKVEKGVVELTGKVKNAKQKDRAEKAARKVKGVKKVINNISIAPV